VIRKVSNFGLSTSRALGGDVFKRLNKLKLDKDKRLKLEVFFKELKDKRCSKSKSTYTKKDMCTLDQEVYEAFVADILDPKLCDKIHRGHFFNSETDYAREKVWRFMKRMMMRANFKTDPDETLESFMDRVGEPNEKSLEELSSDPILEPPHVSGEIDERQVQGSEQTALPGSSDQQVGCQNPIAEEAKRPVPASPELPVKRSNQEETANPSKRSKVTDDLPRDEERRERDEYNLPPIYPDEVEVKVESFGMIGPPEFDQELEEQFDALRISSAYSRLN
jgi:hypothetical protein